MRITDLLEPSNVVADLPSAGKTELLRGLCERLSGPGGITAAKIETCILAREELGSTGIGHGIALPHARVARAAKPCGVFVRLAAPIDFASADGLPVDLVCAIIAPDEPQALALHALATVSRILRDAETVDRLRRAADSRSLYDELVAADAAL